MKILKITAVKGGGKNNNLVAKATATIEKTEKKLLNLQEDQTEEFTQYITNENFSMVDLIEGKTERKLTNLNEKLTEDAIEFAQYITNGNFSLEALSAATTARIEVLLKGVEDLKKIGIDGDLESSTTDEEVRKLFVMRDALVKATETEIGRLRSVIGRTTPGGIDSKPEDELDMKQEEISGSDDDTFSPKNNVGWKRIVVEDVIPVSEEAPKDDKELEIEWIDAGEDGIMQGVNVVDLKELVEDAIVDDISVDTEGLKTARVEEISTGLNLMTNEDRIQGKTNDEGQTMEEATTNETRKIALEVEVGILRKMESMLKRVVGCDCTGMADSCTEAADMFVYWCDGCSSTKCSR